MSKVGRNDPCPCGSGKKYKKCCGGKAADRPATTSDVAPQSPDDEPHEGYAYSPSQQKRWLDRSEVRSHNRIMEMREEDLFSSNFERMTDFERWAACQRLRELGDLRSAEALRWSIARSERSHEAINYVDLLESAIAESLRPRALALESIDRLIDAGPDDARRNRSRALKAALLVEAGDAASAESLFDELEKTEARWLNLDDRIQALMRANRPGDVVSYIDGLDIPQSSLTMRLIAENAKFERALAQERVDRQSASDGWASWLNELETEEAKRLDPGQSEGALDRGLALASKLGGVLESLDDEDQTSKRAMRNAGRRVLDLVRTTVPMLEVDALSLGPAGRRTYRDITDSVVRWILESRYRHHFMETLMEVCEDALAGSGSARTEILELYAGWLTCDSVLAQGGSVLTAFGKERSRSDRWEDVIFAMEASHLDLYRLDSVTQDLEVEVTCVGDGSRTKVPLSALPSHAGLGDAVIGRLLELGDTKTMGHPIVIPREFAAEMSAFLEQRVHDEKEESQLSRSKALKTIGNEIIKYVREWQDRWNDQGLDFPRIASNLEERVALVSAKHSVVDESRTRRLLDEAQGFQRLEEGKDVWVFEENAEAEAHASAGLRPLALVALNGLAVDVVSLTRGRQARATDHLERVLESGCHQESISVTHSVADS